MSKFLIKTIPAAIFWGIFILMVWYIPYPETLAEANYKKVFSFFIPLFLALTLAINLIFKNILSSASISLGLILLLILKALDSLNLITGILTVLAVGLLVSYFKKHKKSLTNYSKIPKLTQLRKK